VIMDDRNETDITRMFLRRVRAAGGEPKRLKGPRGWPDWSVLWPETTLRSARVHFIELKRPNGGRFEPLQRRTLQTLKTWGFRAEVLKNERDIDEYLDSL